MSVPYVKSVLQSTLLCFTVCTYMYTYFLPCNLDREEPVKLFTYSHILIPHSPFQSRYVSQSNASGEFIFKPPGKIPETPKSPITLAESPNFSNKKEIMFTSPSSHRPRSCLFHQSPHQSTGTKVMILSKIYLAYE